MKTPPSVTDMPALKEWLTDKTLVASVSGGKDSAALSLWLHEQGLPHRRVFADTGWEHELTYKHVREILPKHIGQIDEVSAPRQMIELCQYKGMFPAPGAQFCTQELKVKPIFAYLGNLIDEGHEAVNVVGIRAGESKHREDMPEWEWNEDLDCWTWRPLINWSKHDVLAIHDRTGAPLNPLYSMGFSRIGCFPCIHARKAEVRLVAEVEPDRIYLIRTMEKTVGDAAQNRNPNNKRPTWFRPRDSHKGVGIDAVVAWSRGHGQSELFAPRSREDGCMRWGMCETPAEEE